MQPSLTQAGWAGLWTPVLAPRLGYCDFGCNACGQRLPDRRHPARWTSRPSGRRSSATLTSTADRCIPWVDARNCIVCEEMCPVPEKAIVLEDAEVHNRDTGEMVMVRRPVVIHERCIGCGICENRCPVNGQAAIRVYTPTDLP